MPLNLAKPPHVLVVHGVQRGTNSSIKLDRAVSRLIDRVLKASHISEEYVVRQYLYEDENDRHPTVQLSKLLGNAIAAGRPLAGKALEIAVDLVGDVVIAARGGSTAASIRAGLRNEILGANRAGHRVVVLAHSLGTFYALQTINELIAEGDLYGGDDRRHWATQGLITIGSPLGLDLRFGELNVFPEIQIAPLPSDVERLPWHNFYSRHDPIVSGRVFGARVNVDGTDGPVEKRYRSETDDAGWLLHGHTLSTGVKWLLAHTAYWKDPTIGVRLVSMLWG